MHLSRGKAYPQHRAGGTAYGCRGSGPPPAGLPVRRVRMYGLSTAAQCIPAKGRKGRWVLIHPQEALLQEARALQQSAGYEEYRERRVVVEHRLARLVHLGIRQFRYFGRVKTEFQLYLAATVANSPLMAGKFGLGGRQRQYPQRLSGDGGPQWQPRCAFQCRMALVDLAADPADICLTDPTPLPKQGFPARFL